MRHRPRIRIVHCYSCRYAALRTVDRPKALCASASFSVGVTGTVCLGDLRCGGQKGEKQGGQEGCHRHQAKCIQVEDHSPTDEMKPHGKWETVALMPSVCARAACTDATPHAQIFAHLPDTNKLEKPPQAKSSEQKCNPHVDKHRNAPPCSSPTSPLQTPLSPLGYCPGSWQQTGEDRGAVGLHGPPASPLLSSAAITLH